MNRNLGAQFDEDFHHGTDEPGSERIFRGPRTSSPGVLGPALYVTDDEDLALTYAQGRSKASGHSPAIVSGTVQSDRVFTTDREGLREAGRSAPEDLRQRVLGSHVLTSTPNTDHDALVGNIWLRKQGYEAIHLPDEFTAMVLRPRAFHPYAAEVHE